MAETLTPPWEFATAAAVFGPFFERYRYVMLGVREAVATTILDTPTTVPMMAVGRWSQVNTLGILLVAEDGMGHIYPWANILEIHGLPVADSNEAEADGA